MQARYGASREGFRPRNIPYGGQNDAVRDVLRAPPVAAPPVAAPPPMATPPVAQVRRARPGPPGAPNTIAQDPGYKLGFGSMNPGSRSFMTQAPPMQAPAYSQQTPGISGGGEFEMGLNSPFPRFLGAPMQDSAQGGQYGSGNTASSVLNTMLSRGPFFGKNSKPSNYSGGGKSSNPPATGNRI